jgi:hypothetical protein
MKMKRVTKRAMMKKVIDNTPVIVRDTMLDNDDVILMMMIDKRKCSSGEGTLCQRP